MVVVNFKRQFSIKIIKDIFEAKIIKDNGIIIKEKEKIGKFDFTKKEDQALFLLLIKIKDEKLPARVGCFYFKNFT